MKFINKIVAALIEAWGEVKVQKARVILSLVGVTAAVAAMSTVMALGDLLEQSNREMSEAWEGREVTLHISAYKTDNSGTMAGADAYDMGQCVGPGCMSVSSDSDSDSSSAGGTAGDVETEAQARLHPGSARQRHASGGRSLQDHPLVARSQPLGTSRISVPGVQRTHQLWDGQRCAGR